MAKDVLQTNPKMDMQRTINSLNNRTYQLLSDDNVLTNNFMQKDALWQNQKKDMLKVMDSLKTDIDGIKFDLTSNIVYAEKLIVEFRNKVKSEKITSLTNNISTWELDKFVTKKRFNELLTREINNIQK